MARGGRLPGILGVSSCKARCEGITCTVEALSGSRMKTCFRLTGAWKHAPGNRFLELGSGKVLVQVLWEQGLAFREAGLGTRSRKQVLGSRCFRSRIGKGFAAGL